MGRDRGLRMVFAALVVALAAAGTAAAQDRALELVTTGQVGGDALTEFSAVAASADGTTVAFATTERLVAGDQDDQPDLYVRRGGITTIASQGDRNGNLGVPVGGFTVSRDGERVYFLTREQLVAEDTDGTQDVYEHVNGATRLISARAAGAPGPDEDVGIPGRLPPPSDGRIIIETREKLLPADADAATDLYERTDAGLVLLTAGTDLDVGAFDANRSLTHVYFETGKNILASDTDAGQPDTYLTVGGEYTHVSRGPAPEAGGAGPIIVDRVSPDGRRALLITFESLDAGDTDGALDTYLWTPESGPVWLSRPAPNAVGPTCSRAACQVNTYGASEDLGRVAFTTPERLLPTDTDDALDVYAVAGGALELVSSGNGAADVAEAPGGRFGKVSDDGRGVLFTTPESLIAEDADAQVDLYERVDGALRLVSTGEVGAASGVTPGTGTYRNGAGRVLFTSAAAFTRSDSDGNLDVYLRENGATSLISIGRDAYDADYIGASVSGERVFFRTREQLVAEDGDDGRDLYVSRLLPTPTVNAPDTTGPDIGIRLTRRTFRGSSRKATISARRRSPLGTAIDVYTNEGGQVNLSFARMVAGERTARGRCGKRRGRVSKRNRCTRPVNVRGKLKFASKGGRNRIRFYGRVGSRKLKPGRHTVYARAYDAAGNRSRVASATFTLRRR